MPKIRNFLLDKKEKWMKFSLIVIPIIDVLLVMSLSVFLYAFLVRKPFPERFTIQEMDKYMILMGEDVTLILIYLFASLMIFFMLLKIIFAGLTNYLIIIYKKHLNNSVDKRKSILVDVGNYILGFFNMFVPLLFYFFTIIGYKLIWKNKSETTATKRNWTKAYLIISPLALAALVLPLVLVNNIPVIVNASSIKQNLIYSKNKNNFLFLYFDRAQGFLWNSLLEIDKQINESNSFENKFPEFTAYLNTLTSAVPTNLSNPTITGGVWYSPGFLGKNIYNPVGEFNSDTLTQNDYYKSAWSVMLSNLKYNYGYDDISILDIPYYGQTFDEVGGEYQTFDNDLRSMPVNASSTSSSSVLKMANRYFAVNNSDGLRYYNYITEKDENNNPKNLIFENTAQNTAKFLYTQITHANYIYEDKDGKVVYSDRSFPNFIKSMWTSIQKLKDFLSILKNQKYVDSTGNENGETVYDHTFIVVTSDHGITYSQNDVEPSFNRMWNTYLKNSSDFNDMNYETLKNFLSSQADANPVMMIKPFSYSYSVDSKNVSKQTQFSFDKSTYILNSDFPLILDAELYKSTKNANPTTSIYKPAINESKYSENVKKFINNNIVIDPLNHKNDLSNRTFPVLRATNWRWTANQRYFDLWNEFRVVQPSGKNIYDSSIYTDRNINEFTN